MALLNVNGVNIAVTLNGGMARNVDELSDLGRAIDGSLLITQLSDTAGSRKETVSCQTIPLLPADFTTVVNALTGTALPAVQLDGTPVYNAHPVIRSYTPVTTPGPTRRWIISFDLVQA